MGNVICVNDLTKSYRATLAVDHIPLPYETVS